MGNRRKRALALAALSACIVVSAHGAVGGALDVRPGAEAHAVSMAEVSPASASTSGPAGLHPADIADAYALSGGVTGRTVAVVIPYDTPALESDLATYRSTFGLPPCTTANGCFRKYDGTGGTSYPSVDADWSLEASLDVQAVSAACPSCNIAVYEASASTMPALGTAVDTAAAAGVAAVSMSWGVAENANAAYYQSEYFTHPGVALIAATGDSAYPQASMPATFSSVIAVGGTTLSSTTAASSARQAAAAANAVTVTGGTATADTGLTAAQEHAAALARAKSDLAKAKVRAAAAAKALAAAKKAATAQRALLAKARTRVTAAAKKARSHRSAAVDRALATARASAAAHATKYRRAAALVSSRSRTAATITRTVRTLTASVSAAQAVVNTDRTLASTPPTVTTPITVPVTTTPAPVVTSPPVTTVPDPGQTVSTPTSTPTGSPAPAPTRAPNVAPTASFVRTTTGLTVGLDGSSSSDSDGTITSYAWSFGDGSTGTGITASHTYASSGTYPISLTVTDDGGASTTASATATVTAPVVTPPATVSAARGSWMETAWSGAGSGCSSSIAKPAWQTDSACSKRTVADVAADADPNTGLGIYDSGDGGWIVVGGTSLAAPLIAGMMARSGHAANYSDASAIYARSGSFWDVTSGSNGSCSGSAVCTAGVGYDGPTGVGTPKSLSSF